MEEKFELDITDEKEKGLALKEKIENMVASTQLYIVRPLPNFIKMTRNQYEDLLKVNGFVGNMWESKAEFVVTKHNIMEIIIKGEE